MTKAIQIARDDYGVTNGQAFFGFNRYQIDNLVDEYWLTVGTSYSDHPIFGLGPQYTRAYIQAIIEIGMDCSFNGDIPIDKD